VKQKSKGFFIFVWLVISILWAIPLVSLQSVFSENQMRIEEKHFGFWDAISEEAILQEWNRVQGLIAEADPTVQPPEHYFKVIEAHRRFVNGFFRFDSREDIDFRIRFNIEQWVSSIFSTGKINRIQEDFSRVYTFKKMGVVSQEFYGDSRSLGDLSKEGVDLLGYDSISRLFLQVWLITSLLAFGFFFVRVESCGLNPWLELVMLHLPLAAILHPIAWKFYPHWVDTSKQTRQALELASYLLTALVSLVGMGGPLKAQLKGQTSGGETKNSQTKKTKKGTLTPAMEFHPFGSEGVPLLTSQYSWRWGSQLSGFGFADTFDGGWFTNHAVDLVPVARASFLGVSSEQGAGPAGPFWKVGPKVDVGGLPLAGGSLGRPFQFLTASYYSRLAGATGPNELKLVWQTKPLELGRDWQLVTGGFYRILGTPWGSRPNLGQPQIWFRNKGWPRWRFLVEIAIAGRDLEVSTGLAFAP